jgi:aminopeptidase N
MKNLKKTAIAILSILSITIFCSNYASANDFPGPTEYFEPAFDVISYDLQLDLSKAPSLEANGINTIKIKWLKPPNENKFFFQLRGLQVDSVFYNGELTTFSEVLIPDSAKYHYEIQPFAGVAGDTDEVKIFYSGTMSNEGGTARWGGVQSTSTGIYSIGVGFYNNYVSCAQHWMPCFDHPSDKATFKGRFIVPAGKYLASTGYLHSVDFLDNGTDIYTWIQEELCSTYLLAFALDNYVELKISEQEPVVSVYTLPQDTTASLYFYKKVPAITAYFESLFGKYPFAKVGYVNTVVGAMEHQTLIAFPVSIIRNAIATADSMNLTMAHELSHQWFGDMVTCRDFREAWLNEGFARFCESLWLEHVGGFNSYLNNINKTMSSYKNSVLPSEGALPLYDFPRKTPSSNYPTTIYDKGASVLAMLRYKVGDTNFFNAIREYLNENKYSCVTTQTLKDAMEAESGISLDNFFDQWVYGKWLPYLDINTDIISSNDDGTWNCAVKIEQQNSTKYGVYTELPVSFQFNLDDGSVFYYDLIVDSITQNFIINSVPPFKSITINNSPQYRTLMQVFTNAVTKVKDLSPSSEKLQLVYRCDKKCIDAVFGSNSGLATFNVFDYSGNIVSSETLETKDGLNIYSIPTSKLNTGVYFLVVNANGKTQSAKFIVY